MSFEHHHACDCAAHRDAAHDGNPARVGLSASLLPMLACAVCPACLATYAKLLSLVGVSVGFTEFQHSLLLAFAIAVSVLVAHAALRVRAGQRSLASA
jgi:energy-converting hydrogenase Eha subunit E